MADFTYVPDTIDESATFSVDEIQFGDGYKQTIPNGINNALRQWNVSFNDRSQVDVDAMVAFWRVRFGATSFTWRPLGYGVDLVVKCSAYSKPLENRFQNGAFVYSLSATFQEVPL